MLADVELVVVDVADQEHGQAHLSLFAQSLDDVAQGIELLDVDLVTEVLEEVDLGDGTLLPDDLEDVVAGERDLPREGHLHHLMTSHTWSHLGVSVPGT